MAKTPTQALKEMTEAMDRGFAKFIVNTQSKLSAGSPVDTGRLASSWFINKGTPNRSVAPESGTPAKRRVVNGVSVKIPGSNSPVVTVTPYTGKITLDGTWYVSNSLPYAQRAAFDPGYVGRIGGSKGAWFTIIQNNLTRDLTRIMGSEMRGV